MRSAVPVLRWSRTASLLQNCLGRAKVALNCRLQNYFPISLFLIVSFFYPQFFSKHRLPFVSSLFCKLFWFCLRVCKKIIQKQKRLRICHRRAHPGSCVDPLHITNINTRLSNIKIFLEERERERKMYMRRREKEITPTPMRSNAVPTVHRRATKRWTQCPFPGKIWLFLPSLLALGIPRSLCVIDCLFYFYLLSIFFLCIIDHVSRMSKCACCQGLLCVGCHLVSTPCQRAARHTHTLDYPF